MGPEVTIDIHYDDCDLLISPLSNFEKLCFSPGATVSSSRSEGQGSRQLKSNAISITRYYPSMEREITHREATSFRENMPSK